MYTTVRNILNFLLISTLFLVPVVTFAQEDDSADSFDTSPTSLDALFVESEEDDAPLVLIIAEVNIREATLVKQEENILTVSFDIDNDRTTQSGIKYSVRLTQNVDGGNIVIDEYVYAQVLTLGIGESVHIEVEYIAPAYLAGDYTLWVTSSHESGLPLSLGNAGEVSLSGDGAYVEILTDSCALEIKEEKEGERYPTWAPLDILSGETLILVCDVVSHFPDSISVTPMLETREGSEFGAPVEIVAISYDTIVLEEEEITSVRIEIPLAIKPQQYIALIRLSGDDSISNTISALYSVSGASATINNFVLARDYYVRGDIAIAVLTWSTSLDKFVFRTPEENSILGDLYVTIDIKDNNGKDCVESETFNIAETGQGNKPFRLPVVADCLDPTATATLVNAEGNIFTTMSTSVVSSEKNIQAKSPVLPSVRTIIILLGVVLIILVLGFVAYKKHDTMEQQPDE